VHRISILSSLGGCPLYDVMHARRPTFSGFLMGWRFDILHTVSNSILGHLREEPRGGAACCGYSSIHFLVLLIRAGLSRAKLFLSVSVHLRRQTFNNSKPNGTIASVPALLPCILHDVSPHSIICQYVSNSPTSGSPSYTCLVWDDIRYPVYAKMSYCMH
jgi:hypothetical protein